MKDLFDKLSSYNIFNYLLPGVLFAYFAEKITSYHIIHKDFLTAIFLYYFIGLVISRLGSLILEPILRKIRFVKFAPYEDFVRCAKDDPKLDILSEANNMYRTLASLFFSIVTLVLYEKFTKGIGISRETSNTILCILLFILFVWSYRKQTAYITKRIKGWRG